MTRTVGLIALALLALTAAPFAHPESTTEIAIRLTGRGPAVIEITADREPLLRKLEVFAGLPAGAATVNELVHQGTGGRLSLELFDRIDLRADRAPVTLAWLDAAPSPGDRLVMRLAAAIPAQTQSLSFSSSLVFGAYPVVVRRGNVSTTAFWLQGTESTPEIWLSVVAPPAGFAALWRYFQMGYTHILPHGLDHILFVLGLFLLNRQVRAVAVQASAFTIAHSITLGLSLYGVVSLPSAVVEPLIALSIVYVAFENLFTSSVRRRRLALVFAFGLLHGLGFADAIARLDLPRSEFLTALVTFNFGVEAGQLSVIAAAMLVVARLRVAPERYERRVAWPASAAIAAIGIFWTVTRLPWFSA